MSADHGGPGAYWARDRRGCWIRLEVMEDGSVLARYTSSDAPGGRARGWADLRSRSVCSPQEGRIGPIEGAPGARLAGWLADHVSAGWVTASGLLSSPVAEGWPMEGRRYEWAGVCGRVWSVGGVWRFRVEDDGAGVEDVEVVDVFELRPAR